MFQNFGACSALLLNASKNSDALRLFLEFFCSGALERFFSGNWMTGEVFMKLEADIKDQVVDVLILYGGSKKCGIRTN